MSYQPQSVSLAPGRPFTERELDSIKLAKMRRFLKKTFTPQFLFSGDRRSKSRIK